MLLHVFSLLDLTLFSHILIIALIKCIQICLLVTENLLSASVAAEKMTVLAKGVKGILTAFATAKFVASFTVDEEDIADKIFAESSFVEVNGTFAKNVVSLFDRLCALMHACVV